MQMPSSISTRLHYQHKALMDILEEYNDDQVRRTIHPGKWSIFENIVHLQTYQHVFNSRVKKILEGNNPVFEKYTADTDTSFLDNCSLSTREILQDLITTRKEMTASMSAIPEADFTKAGTHPFFGKMKLLEWMNFFLLHEAHHLYTIFKLGADLKKA